MGKTHKQMPYTYNYGFFESILFTATRSSTDAMQAIRILMEKHSINNKDLHLAFLDLKKAFY